MIQQNYSNQVSPIIELIIHTPSEGVAQGESHLCWRRVRGDAGPQPPRGATPMNLRSDEDLIEGLASETKNNREGVDLSIRLIDRVLKKFALEGSWIMLGLRHQNALNL